ncbi:MAG: hypothetical protein AAF611_02945 [Bacteroidota bacterium]
MKKILVVALGLLMIACGSEEKKKNDETAKQGETKTEVVKETTKTNPYPKVEKQYPVDMNIMYDEGYLFDEKIQLDEIAVVPSAESNSYDLVMFFNDKTTDFKALEDYRVGLILYPKDPSKLASPKDQKAKKKKIGKVAKVQNLEGEYVVVIDNFKVNPKDFKQVRLYLYDAKGVVLNENFLKIANVVFP